MRLIILVSFLLLSIFVFNNKVNVQAETSSAATSDRKSSCELGPTWDQPWKTKYCFM